MSEGRDRDRGDELERMIARHLAYQPTSEPLRLVREQLQRLLVPMARPRDRAQLGEDAAQMLGALGLSDAALSEATRNLSQARELGIEMWDLVPLIQAYARGVGQIADAEAALLRALLRSQPEAEQLAYLDRLLTDLLPLVTRAFEVVHASLLGATMRDDLLPELADETESSAPCVALIDLCGSTAFLRDADESQALQLVDVLFQTGQACALERGVRVWKYVGDGMFLAGRDVADMARVCFGAVEQIEASLPLSARAGIATGPLLRRSGDYFGFSVNVAHLLTKVARPGEVLTTAEVAAGLPRAARGRLRRQRIRGWDERLEVVALKRPGVAGGA